MKKIPWNRKTLIPGKKVIIARQSGKRPNPTDLEEIERIVKKRPEAIAFRENILPIVARQHYGEKIPIRRIARTIGFSEDKIYYYMDMLGMPRLIPKKVIPPLPRAGKVRQMKIPEAQQALLKEAIDLFRQGKTYNEVSLHLLNKNLKGMARQKVLKKALYSAYDEIASEDAARFGIKYKG